MSTENFNDLSNQETERLACLMEECSESIQIIGKILRHGYSSAHPDNEYGPDNRDMLNTELGHVLHWIKEMDRLGDIDMKAIQSSSRTKARRLANSFYLHHQPQSYEHTTKH